MSTKSARPADPFTATFQGMEAAFKGCAEAMNACWAAQRRLVDETIAATERTWTDRGPAVPVMPAIEELRAAATRAMSGSIELGARTINDLTVLASENTRHATTVVERAADALMGPEAARTPEAAMATFRTLAGDAMERTSATVDQLTRLGARNIEAFQSLVSGAMNGAARTATRAAAPTKG